MSRSIASRRVSQKPLRLPPAALVSSFSDDLDRAIAMSLALERNPVLERTPVFDLSDIDRALTLSLAPEPRFCSNDIDHAIALSLMPPPRARTSGAPARVAIMESRITGRVVKALANGSCGPNSVMLALSGAYTKEGSFLIRTQVVEYYRSSPRTYADVRREHSAYDLPEDVHAYCAHMGIEGVHFTAVEWHAIAAVYGLYVAIVDADSSIVTDAFGSPDNELVAIRYETEIRFGAIEQQRAGHYDLIEEPRIS